MQTVFDNSGLAHAWAHQVSPFGRSNNGNFYFQGRALFSYGPHFLVGYLMPDGAALLNSDSYSISTGQHQGQAAGAVSHLVTYRLPELTDAFHGLERMAGGDKARARELLRDYLEAHAEALAQARPAPTGAQRDQARREAQDQADREGRNAEPWAEYARREGEALARILDEDGAPDALTYLCQAVGLTRSRDKMLRQAVARREKEEARKAQEKEEAQERAARNLASEKPVGVTFSRQLSDILARGHGVQGDLEELNRDLLRAQKWTKGRKGFKRIHETLKARRALVRDALGNLEALEARALGHRKTRDAVAAIRGLRKKTAAQEAAQAALEPFGGRSDAESLETAQTALDRAQARVETAQARVDAARGSVEHNRACLAHEEEEGIAAATLTHESVTRSQEALEEAQADLEHAQEDAQALQGALEEAQALLEADGLETDIQAAQEALERFDRAYALSRTAYGYAQADSSPDARATADNPRHAASVESQEVLALIEARALERLATAPSVPAQVKRAAQEALDSGVARNAQLVREVRKARKDKSEQRRAQERLEREREARESWIAGNGRHWRGSDAHGGAYLRAVNVTRDDSGEINGGTLETSQGASVPLAHALRVFRFLKHCRETGRSWKRNGATLRVGHFHVDSVEPDGTFRAGCHLIRWEQVEALARRLGVADLAAQDVTEKREFA